MLKKTSHLSKIEIKCRTRAHGSLPNASIYFGSICDLKSAKFYKYKHGTNTEKENLNTFIVWYMIAITQKGLWCMLHKVQKAMMANRTSYEIVLHKYHPKAILWERIIVLALNILT